MNAAHLHLATTHLPVLGFAFGVILLVWSCLRRSAELKRTALGVLVLAALLSLPAYLSGAPAMKFLPSASGFTQESIDQHAEVAQVALAGSLVVGTAALAGLVVYRAPKSFPGWFAAALVALGLVIAALMGWTANLGGRIHHPEIRVLQR